MFHQFVDKMEHPIDEMAAEDEFKELVSAKGAVDGELSSDSLLVVNGVFDKACVIDDERHVLRPVKGVAFDEERPVFSSTASWLLGRNFSELEGEALEVAELLDGERTWGEVVSTWAAGKSLSTEEASKHLAPVAKSLLDERFVRYSA